MKKIRNKKEYGRKRRHRRIRKKICGTEERPRLVVYRSLSNFYVQLIDDVQAKTLISLSTMDKKIRGNLSVGKGGIKAAEVLGKIFSEKAKVEGIKKVVFDRGGYLYHGRVKAFAEVARKGGLEF